MKNLIKQFREKKSLSQRDLAKMIGTTQKQVSKWEKGEDICFVIAITIAKFLEVDPKDVFSNFESLQRKHIGESKEVLESGLLPPSQSWMVIMEFEAVQERWEYLVDLENYEAVTNQISNLEIKEAFLCFRTKDDRLVLVNPTYLVSCELDDDIASSPRRPTIGDEDDVSYVLTSGRELPLVFPYLSPEQAQFNISTLDGYQSGPGYISFETESQGDHFLKMCKIVLAEFPISLVESEIETV